MFYKESEPTLLWPIEAICSDDLPMPVCVCAPETEIRGPRRGG